MVQEIKQDKFISLDDNKPLDSKENIKLDSKEKVKKSDNKEHAKEYVKKSDNKDSKKFADNKKKKVDFFSTIICTRRVTNVTKFGRTLSFVVTIACGDRKGSIGYGSGKAKEVVQAKMKALNAAKKNMIQISLLENRTIYHDQKAKFGASIVLLRKAKAGTGLIAGPVIKAICSLVGIKDIVSKSFKSRTTYNVLKAGVKALSLVNSHTFLAYRRGLDYSKKNVENK